MNKNPQIMTTVTYVPINNCEGTGVKSSIDKWCQEPGSFSLDNYNFNFNSGQPNIIITFEGTEHRNSIKHTDMTNFMIHFLLVTFWCVLKSTNINKNHLDADFLLDQQSEWQTRLAPLINSFSSNLSSTYNHLWDTDEDGNYIYNQVDWTFSVELEFKLILSTDIDIRSENYIYKQGTIQSYDYNYAFKLKKSSVSIS